MALVDPSCFPGLSSTEKMVQIYEALYVKIPDPTGFTDPSCFAGLSNDLKLQAIYAALYATIP